MQLNKSNSKAINEEYLWENLISGKEWALSKLFELHYDELYFFARGFLKDQDEAKDLIQDLFLKIWTKRAKLTKVKHVKPYLFKVLRTIIADYFRIKKKWNTINLDAESYTFQVPHEEYLITVETEQEYTTKLRAALESLTNREREIIYLRFYAKVEYEKICSIMNLKYQSLRNLVYGALQKIKNQYNS